MNDDPTARRTPAPEDRREQEDARNAAELYRLDHYAGYREHTARRNAASALGWEEAERLYPGMGEIRKAHRHARLYLRKWDKANPNPLTWEDYERLTKEYAIASEPNDRR